jgi:predicted nucleic acid-binding protein
MKEWLALIDEHEPTDLVQVRSLLPEAWTFRHNLTIGDALYVVLARHLGACARHR